MLKRSIAIGTVAGILSTNVMSADNIFGGIQYEFKDNLHGLDSRSYRLELGTKLLKGFSVDNRTYITDLEKYGNSTSQSEIGVGLSIPTIDGLSIYTRAAVGYNFDDKTKYGSVEIGPEFYITDSVIGKASYIYGDSFDDEVKTRYNAFYVGTDFQLNYSNSIETGVTYSTDQVEYTSYSIAWNYKF